MRRFNASRTGRDLIATTLSVVFMLAVTGCGQDDQEGPAEQMGKQIDISVQETGEKAEAAMDQGSREVNGTMEQAGKKMDQAVESAREGLATAAERASERLDAASQSLRQENARNDQ